MITTIVLCLALLDLIVNIPFINTALSDFNLVILIFIIFNILRIANKNVNSYSDLKKKKRITEILALVSIYLFSS